MNPPASPEPPPLEILTATGSRILPWIPDAARLRLAVFRGWPYLYEGDEDYERDYLLTYSQAPDSVFIIAKAGTEVVGISTGIPLIRETGEVLKPFLEAGMDPAKVFYFGESVLLPEWRGRGTGVRFFHERECYARSLSGINTLAFCAVDRAPDHPMKPHDYVPLDSFWKKRGFHKSNLRTQFTWKETGEPEASPKSLTFWIKPLS